MTPRDVETVYEALAERLDAAGEGRRELLLARLALLLAHDLGDAGLVLRRIEEAARTLDA